MLERILQNLIYNVMEETIIISMLIIFVALFYTQLDRVFGAKWRKLLWLLLAIRLCIPFHYSIPDAPIHIIKWNIAPRLLVVIWACGVLVYTIYQITNYAIFRKKCIREMKPIENTDILEAFREAAYEIGITKRVPLYKSQAARTPLIFGNRNKILLIPDENYSHDDIRIIFLHECTHLMKNDIGYKLIMQIVNAMMWFNPFVYWMKSLAFRDIEITCDQSVIGEKALEERKNYSRIVLDSLRRQKNYEIPNSTYFYNGKNAMKERIQNIMNEKKPRKGILFLFIVLIAAECLGMLISCGYDSTASKKYNLNGKESLEKMYTAYERPDAFSENVVNEMLALAPSTDIYQYLNNVKNNYNDLAPGDTSVATDNPYQVVCEDPDKYANSVPALVERFAVSFRSADELAQNSLETMPRVSGITEINSNLIAGDASEFVYQSIFEIFLGKDYEESTAYKNKWGEIRFDGNFYYAYCDWTVHAKLVADHIYELEGITDTKAVTAAFQAKYPDNKWLKEIPSLELPKTSDCTYKINENQLYVTYDGGNNWVQVPIAMNDLFNRGDWNGVTGTSLESGSYYISPEKTVFAYGGSGQTKLSILESSDKGQNWSKAVVSPTDYSVRRIFTDFPENAKTGYLIDTAERVSYQEGNLIYKTTDGGSTWQPVKCSGLGDSGMHSLTTGASFATNEIGFVTVRSSEEPVVYQTLDGGVTWKKMKFIQNPETFYTMAYAPVFDGNNGVLYIGEDQGYENKGIFCKYISSDSGRNWTFAGMVYRQ